MNINIFFQVLFTFKRCARVNSEDGDNGGSAGTPVMEDDRMGFIMFEAGLENVALRYITLCLVLNNYE